MVERSLSMREAPGSIPGLSSTALRVGGLYSSVGQSARLVSARSRVRTSVEAHAAFCLCHCAHVSIFTPPLHTKIDFV
jgi:hypothetical protein